MITRRSARSLCCVLAAGVLFSGTACADIYARDSGKGVELSDIAETGYSILVKSDVLRTEAAPQFGDGPRQSKIKKRREHFSSLIESAAIREGIAPELLHAIVTVESGYNPSAVSKKGAIGLMQLMPETATRLGVSSPANAESNLAGGAKLIRMLLDRYQGNLPLALAAYNAGEGAVARSGHRIPRFPETLAYVPTVLRHYGSLLGEPGRANVLISIR